MIGLIRKLFESKVVSRDAKDSVYKTKREKLVAVVNEIRTVHAEGRPVLVGTNSGEEVAILSEKLSREGIVHSVVQGKGHQQEAEVVARAGQMGAVTIAVSMAGCGTDIVLGPGVAEIGGLHVIGTERHEARRLDEQLSGLYARQGDPGSSHFFVSLEDDLMRLFGSDRILKYMEKMGIEEGQRLEHPLLNRSIEQAQKRAEQHNLEVGKRVVESNTPKDVQRPARLAPSVTVTPSQNRRIMNVTIFVTDIGAAAAAKQAGSIVERIPPNTLIPTADAALGLTGALISHFADKPMVFEDAPLMSDDQWKTFLDARFPGCKWTRWFGNTPTAIFSVVVVLEAEPVSAPAARREGPVVRVRLRCNGGCGGEWEMNDEASAKFRKTDVVILPPCPNCGSTRYPTNA